MSEFDREPTPAPETRAASNTWAWVAGIIVLLVLVLWLTGVIGNRGADPVTNPDPVTPIENAADDLDRAADDLGAAADDLQDGAQEAVDDVRQGAANAVDNVNDALDEAGDEAEDLLDGNN